MKIILQKKDCNDPVSLDDLKCFMALDDIGQPLAFIYEKEPNVFVYSSIKDPDFSTVLESMGLNKRISKPATVDINLV